MNDPFRNLLLNPTNILAIGSDDPDFVQLEESGEVQLFTTLVPAKQAFDDFTHCLEVQIPRERGIISAGSTKGDVHG